MPTKNPHAVAMGRIKTPARAAASRANGQQFGGRPPQGISRTLWRQVLERCRAEGLTLTELYTRLFTRYLDETYPQREERLLHATDPAVRARPDVIDDRGH